jgi:integrase
MGYSLKLQLNKGGRQNKTGLYSIYLRVIINRHAYFFNLEKKVQRVYWQDKEDQWLKPSFKFHREWNQYLRNKFDSVRHYVYRLEAEDHAVTADIIREFIEKKNGNSNIFNHYVDEYLARRLTGLRANSIKKYDTFKRYIDKYQTLTFSQINEPMILDFCHWLNRSNNLHGSTINKYIDCFRMITRSAWKEGYFKSDPFKGVRIPYSEKRKTDQDRLTIDQIRMIKKVELSEQIDRVRLDFLFCCYGAFRLSDMALLKWSNVQTCEAGIYILYSRHKTGKPAVVPLWKFAGAIDILNQQKGLHEEFIFPHLGCFTDMDDESMKKFDSKKTTHNRKLKQIAKKCGLFVKLTNSVGRHSNAQLWARAGFPIQYISKHLGHQYLSTTLQYFELNEVDVVNYAADNETSFDI